jgi:hypothetical protein
MASENNDNCEKLTFDHLLSVLEEGPCDSPTEQLERLLKAFLYGVVYANLQSRGIDVFGENWVTLGEFRELCRKEVRRTASTTTLDDGGLVLPDREEQNLLAEIKNRKS